MPYDNTCRHPGGQFDLLHNPPEIAYRRDTVLSNKWDLIHYVYVYFLQVDESHLEASEKADITESIKHFL